MVSGVDSSTISSLGIGSGLDLSSLLDGLKNSEQSRLVPLQTQESSYKAQLSAYGKLGGALKDVQSAADKLADSSLYKTTAVTTNAKAFSTTGSADAVPGSYTVNVDQIAQAQSLVAKPVASTSAPIGAGGTITLALGDGDGQTTSSAKISISSGDSTLAGIRDAINNAGLGVSASIINDGSATPYRLVLSADATGTDSQISVSATDAATGGTTPLADLLDYNSASGSGALQQTVAAQNAKLEVNGIAIASQSNTVADAIQGVTLSLSAATASPQKLTAARDTDTVASAISDFVKAYNQYHSVSAGLTAYQGPDAKNGVLLGDSTARTVQTRLRGALNTPVAGEVFSGLAQIGVALQKDGTLAVDDDKLGAALREHLDGVAHLLAGNQGTPGVAGGLSDTIQQLEGIGGALTAATDGTHNRIKDVDGQITNTQKSIDSTIERYRQQFVQLDSLLSSLNATQSYLTTQLDQLNHSSGGAGNGNSSS